MKKLILCFIMVSCSCSERELPNYDNQTFLNMGRVGDPNLRIILPGSISEVVIDCNEYTPSCRYGVKVVVKNIEMKALYYDDQKSALAAAKRFKGYIARNWALDDVRGEPILERFAEKYLDAIPAK